MRRQGTVSRLSIIVREDDQHHHHPLYSEIVSRARKAGLAGATVLRGVQGFGAAAVLHEVHAIMNAAPVQIVIVDTADRIADFVPLISPLVDNGLLTVEEVTAIRYDGDD